MHWLCSAVVSCCNPDLAQHPLNLRQGETSAVTALKATDERL